MDSSLPHQRHRGQDSVGGRQDEYLSLELTDGTPSILFGDAEQVADVEEARDVVETVTGDRVSRMVAFLGEYGCLCDRHLSRDEVHLSARTHHGAKDAVTGSEDVAEHAPLVLLETLVGGDDVTQLFLGELLSGSLGSPPRSRTMVSVETESKAMAGRIRVLKRSSGGATTSEKSAARWSASRFGTSSPSTSDR